MPQLVWLTILSANAIHNPEVNLMSENQQNPPLSDTNQETEPEDPRWYLQNMYDLAMEPIEVGQVGKKE